MWCKLCGAISAWCTLCGARYVVQATLREKCSARCVMCKLCRASNAGASYLWCKLRGASNVVYPMWCQL
eukprot:4252907-Pyramimonas_sp.AAC.1